MTFYRYEDHIYSTISIDPGGNEHYGTTPVQLNCLTFELVKETPKGYWIGGGILTPKWISKRTGHFAFPSQLKALQSFQRRKQSQMGIYRARLRRAEEAYGLANLAVIKILEARSSPSLSAD